MSADTTPTPIGPHLVRTAVGEDVTQEQLGGSRVHCGIPLVFLVDVPGFVIATKVEAAGIIRHGEDAARGRGGDRPRRDPLSQAGRRARRRVERPWKRHGVMPV